MEPVNRNYNPYHYAVVTEGRTRPLAYFEREADAVEWAASRSGQVVEWDLPKSSVLGMSQNFKPKGLVG